MTTPEQPEAAPPVTGGHRRPGSGHVPLGEAVRATSLMTLVSRFFGMIRDVLLVQIFGATAVGSAFAAAFQIPNLFRRLFGEGALSAAFVPEYAVAAKNDRGSADRLASFTMVRLAAVTAALTVVIEIALLVALLMLPPADRGKNVYMPPLPAGAEVGTVVGWHVKVGDHVAAGTPLVDITTTHGPIVLRAPRDVRVGDIVLHTGAPVRERQLLISDPDGTRAFSIKLMMVMFPLMPAVCMAAILAAMLQVHGRFAASMTGAFFLNTFIVVLGVFFLVTRRQGGEITAYVLALATVAAGVSQVLWFRKLLRPMASWTRAYDDAKPTGRRMLGKFVPVIIGLGGLQLSSFIDLVILMWPIWVGPTILGHVYPLDVKSNIILRSTQLLYAFPLGVFGVAVATAVFPMLARVADQPSVFLDTLRRGLRLSLFIGLPASIGLVLIREDLTRVLFSVSERRGFNTDDLARSANVLLGYAPAVWAFSLNHVLTRAFYAKGDMTTPMRLSLVMVVVNFILNASLIWMPSFGVLGVTVPALQESALAWSTSLCAMVQTIILMEIAKKRFCPPNEPIIDSPTARAIGRVVTATIVMGALVALTKQVWVVTAQSPYWLSVLRLLACTGAGALVYVGEAAFSKSPELNWLTSRPKSRGDAPSLQVE